MAEIATEEIRLEKSLESIRERIPFRPEIALVLGSGLGGFAEEMEITSVIPYREIEAFPRSTVEGHQGRFVFGRIRDVPVVAMQGRVHYYEGYSMQEVVHPIRLMQKMGAKVLILTNAAGGLHSEWAGGALMMIRDQIANLVPSPLIGANPDTLGERFPDMSQIYDLRLQELIRDSAEKEKIPLEEGVYVQTSGPQYETPAEVRMLQLLGGDAVGMSTACEAIAARHCGFRVCGISCITNLAAGLSEQKLSHQEVQAGADQMGKAFCRLVKALIIEAGRSDEKQAERQAEQQDVK
jgi:purine-nucleoside phosphorylase